MHWEGYNYQHCLYLYTMYVCAHVKDLIYLLSSLQWSGFFRRHCQHTSTLLIMHLLNGLYCCSHCKQCPPLCVGKSVHLGRGWLNVVGSMHLTVLWQHAVVWNEWHPPIDQGKACVNFYHLKGISDSGIFCPLKKQVEMPSLNVKFLLLSHQCKVWCGCSDTVSGK